MKELFEAYKNVVVRTPMWKFESVDELDENKLLTTLDDKFFNEALWLASPVLHAEARKWKDGTFDKKNINKLIYSLSKYYQRLCTRTTPFGLFAGFSIVPLDKSNSLTEDCDFRRVTRLDMEFVCKLIQSIESNIEYKKLFTYKSNNSIYCINNQYRYYEYYYESYKKKYLLSSIEKSEYLENIFANCKIKEVSYKDLVSILVDQDIEHEEAEMFINELIDNQLLISNISPAVSSKNILDDLIRELIKTNEIVFGSIINLLNEVGRQLQILDSNKINNVLDYYHISDLLKVLNIDFDISKLFQIDIYKITNNIEFDENLLENIFEAMDFLHPLYNFRSSPGIEQFIKQFEARFAKQELPLPFVLDCDLGIGFNENIENSLNTPIIENIVEYKINEGSIELNKSDNFFFSTLIEARINNKLNINLEDFLKKSTHEKDKIFNDISSWLFAFSVVNIEGKEFIAIKYSVPTNINSLLARFGHIDEHIENMLKEISSHEMESHPEYIIADIIHFPEDRTGNVILRPEIYPYQIPFLGNATCSPDKIISIDDIYVSVKDGKIFLRSKKMNKFIIPRLSNAHNFSNNSTLSIYRFLCTMQYQNRLKNIEFSWGAVRNFSKFLPRVTYKNVILSLATWKISNSDIREILNAVAANNNDISELVHTWQTKNSIPDRFILADHDLELYVNIKNKLSLFTFLDEVKKRNEFVIKEFLHNSNENPESYLSRFTHEIQVPLIRKPNVNDQVLSHRQLDFKDTYSSETTRKFIPGSNIIYMKIYGGNKIIEKIFLNQLYPIIKSFSEKSIISKWHFIKYSDPDFHLRIRLFLNNQSDYKLVQNTLNVILEEGIKENIIHEISHNIFNRELERYGHNLIHFAEEFFGYDSVCITEILKSIIGSANSETYRWMAALTNIDFILDAAGFDIQRKHDFIKPIRESFFNEFNGGINLNRSLSAKYRESRKSIEIALPTAGKNRKNEFYRTLEQIFIERDIKTKPLFLSLITNYGQEKFLSLLPSYIHMSLNRIFLARPRKHELVIYDFLQRTYNSMNSIRKQLT